MGDLFMRKGLVVVMNVPRALESLKKKAESLEYSTSFSGAGDSVSMIGHSRSAMRAFQAYYPDGKWGGALVIDSSGIETELRFDYSIGKMDRKRMEMSDERADRLEREREWEYNDGGTYFPKRKWITNNREFLAWLNS